MAHKSKTQRAKASVAKANKKDRQEREEAAVVAAAVEAGESPEEAKAKAAEKVQEAKAVEKKQQAVAAKEEKPKPKKVRFQFLRDVRAEMKRVTWPSRQDVIRWSGVVVGALLFFGIYVAILDNAIVTPALVALSGLGA